MFGIVEKERKGKREKRGDRGLNRPKVALLDPSFHSLRGCATCETPIAFEHFNKEKRRKKGKWKGRNGSDIKHTIPRFFKRGHTKCRPAARDREEKGKRKGGGRKGTVQMDAVTWQPLPFPFEGAHLPLTLILGRWPRFPQRKGKGRKREGERREEEEMFCFSPRSRWRILVHSGRTKVLRCHRVLEGKKKKGGRKRKKKERGEADFPSPFHTFLLSSVKRL